MREYVLLEKPYRIESEKYRKAIFDIPDWHPLKVKYAHEFEEYIYSKIPSEKAADKYAMENIETAMDKIRVFLGYDEMALLLEQLS